MGFLIGQIPYSLVESVQNKSFFEETQIRYKPSRGILMIVIFVLYDNISLHYQ